MIPKRGERKYLYAGDNNPPTPLWTPTEEEICELEDAKYELLELKRQLRMNDDTVTSPICFDDLWRNGFTFSVRKAGSKERVIAIVDPNNLNAVYRTIETPVVGTSNKDTVSSVESGRYIGHIINGEFFSCE